MIVYPTAEDTFEAHAPPVPTLTQRELGIPFGFEYIDIAPVKYELISHYAVETPFAGFPGEHILHAVLADNGTLVLSPGYRWDGPSGPCPDLQWFMRSSAVHDALCRTMDRGVIPDKYQRRADALFRRQSIEDGCPQSIAWLCYMILRRYDAHNNARRKSRHMATTARALEVTL
jgi:hypothetical protein